MSYCCKEGLVIEHIDVETALFNGKVLLEIDVNKLRGYEDGTVQICKLLKVFHVWQNQILKEVNCIIYCLYAMKDRIEIYLNTSVDDLLICCK